MLAYYLLGRFHTNIGEAPQALQTYYDAIDKADTTSTNCDYSTLAAIYGQMSRIFHQQNLPNDEIWALRHYIEYIRETGKPERVYCCKRAISTTPITCLTKKTAFFR